MLIVEGIYLETCAQTKNKRQKAFKVTVTVTVTITITITITVIGKYTLQFTVYTPK